LKQISNSCLFNCYHCKLTSLTDEPVTHLVYEVTYKYFKLKVLDTLQINMLIKSRLNMKKGHSHCFTNSSVNEISF